MFDNKIYIPILRWKDAEKKGLAKLDTEVMKRLSPCFEFVMPSPKLNEKFKIVKTSKEVWAERIPKITDEFNKYCLSDVALVDVHFIDSDLRVQTIKHILDNHSKINAKIIPVTHILPVNSTEADMKVRELAIEHAKSTEDGICIRIDRFNINDGNLSQVIDEFLSTNQLSIAATDIIIDLGLVDDTTSAEALCSALRAIPQIKACRTFILASGAFPPDLTDIEPFTTKQVTRNDWLLFQKMSPLLAETSRNPVYSDFTIQHPAYGEPISGGNTSASIRYASDTFWQIYRGKGLRGKSSPGFVQYTAQAKLLVNDPVFKKDCCAGDSYVSERATDETKTGNPTTWLTAGINHHMSLVITQLTS